jgi:hypothetical protein
MGILRASQVCTGLLPALHCIGVGVFFALLTYRLPTTVLFFLQALPKQQVSAHQLSPAYVH